MAELPLMLNAATSWARAAIFGVEKVPSQIRDFLKACEFPTPIFPKTCEICHATAVNVAGEHINEAENTIAATAAEPVATARLTGQPRFWHGRSIMNVLLACMIVAFVLS